MTKNVLYNAITQTIFKKGTSLDGVKLSKRTHSKETDYYFFD